MLRYAKTILLVLLCFAAGQGVARTISVSSASAINKTWSAGDTLVFVNGSYSNLNLTLNGTGTAASPIVLRAATPGAVFLSGSSSLTIKGTYIEVQGLRFSGTFTGKNQVVLFASGSSHCRLTECAIEAYNPTDVSKDIKWVSLYGQQHRVDHCYFVGKANMGTLLVVWLENNITPVHRIEANHFGYRIAQVDGSGKELNGQEIIRIGDSNSSMQQAQCTVEGNYFENCDGEIEIISNKSCGNTYRGNTFYNCAGTLTIRHGNGCTVDANWFLGNNKSASGGVRIIGENHTVTDNYFQDLTGNNYRAALCIVRGKPNSALNEYFQVKNAVVNGNIFVNCKEAFCVNYHSSSDCDLLALNTTIDNNTVFNDNSHTSDRVVTRAGSGGTLTWSGNSYNAGKFSSFSPTAAEWSKNTSMAQPVMPGSEPSAETTGPAWRHPTSPTETVDVQGSKLDYKVRKILQDGHIYILLPDRKIFIL